MPNPAKYKDKKKFMEDCIHQTLHVEKKNKDQSLAQCLNMWRDKNKGKKCCLADDLRIIGMALEEVEGKYIREKGKGTPGQPDYKPPLWYWITPSGKKKLVDQKSME